MNMIWDKKYQRKIHVALWKPFSLEIQCGLCTVRTIAPRIHCPQFSVITLLVEPLQHCTTKCFQFKNLSQTI